MSTCLNRLESWPRQTYRLTAAARLARKHPPNGARPSTAESESAGRVQDVDMQDWVEWHRAYEDSSSALSARLECVKLHLAQAIDQAPPGPLRLLSLCAGQGLDVIGVLPGHRRRDDVHAVLVELDERNAELAAVGAARSGLNQVQIRRADAGQMDNFADAAPVDVLLLCGIFGNVSDADIERTVGAASALCAPAATVIWTRHRRPPDLTPRIREWFAAGGFDEVAFEALGAASLTGVGVNRFTGATTSVSPAGRLFSFRPRAVAADSGQPDTPARCEHAGPHG